METIRVLLDSGADVDSKNREGNTALMESWWDPAIRTQLLDIGASVNIKFRDGETLLMKAIAKEDKEFIEELLSREVDATAKDKGGKTAMDHAKEHENLVNTNVYWLLNDALYN